MVRIWRIRVRYWCSSWSGLEGVDDVAVSVEVGCFLGRSSMLVVGGVEDVITDSMAEEVMLAVLSAFNCNPVECYGSVSVKDYIAEQLETRKGLG